MLPVLLLAMGIVCAEDVTAQVHPDRAVVTNPLWTPLEGAGGWIHSFGGWISFGPYVQIEDEDHLWNHQIAGFVEVYRPGDRASLFVTTQFEFIADGDNDIYFNPRSVFWEEGIVYTHRFYPRRDRPLDWQIGYYQRCKHETDNLSDGTQRSLIFGSAMTRVIRPLDLPGTDRGYITARGDLYTFRQDMRTPREYEELGTNVNRKLADVGFQGHTRYPLGDQAGWFVTAWGSLSLYSENSGATDRFEAIDEVLPNGGVSTGASFLGVESGTAEVRIAFTWEYVADTGLPVKPRGSHLFRITATALTPGSVR